MTRPETITIGSPATQRPRWGMQLSLTQGCDDLQLSGTSVRQEARAAWQFKPTPQPNRRTS